jgi:hypothetical protein
MTVVQKGSRGVVFLEETRTNGIDTNEMRWHGGCISIVPILFVPLFPSYVFLERWQHEWHDQLVVIRREGQQIARAAHRFCASKEVTGVLAGKRFCCSFPGQLDVIHSERAATTEI